MRETKKIFEQRTPITTPDEAAFVADADAAYWYEHDSHPVWCDPQEMLRDRVIGEPFGGFTKEEIETAYIKHFALMWNALLSMDEAASKISTETQKYMRVRRQDFDACRRIEVDRE